MEHCNECGRSVAPGSGNFVNRVPDCNSVDERKAMGKPYPDGNWLCAQCEATFDAQADGWDHCRNCQAVMHGSRKAIRVDSPELGEPLFFCKKQCYDEFYGLGLWAVRGEGARQLVTLAAPRHQ